MKIQHACTLSIPQSVSMRDYYINSAHLYIIFFGKNLLPCDDRMAASQTATRFFPPHFQLFRRPALLRTS